MNLKTIDCETGGFDAEKCGLTQIAISVVNVDTLQGVERYQSYVKPYDNKVYEKEALEGTRLSLEFLEQNGQLPKVVAKEIVAFFKKHSPKKGYKDRSVFVGHNPLFDIMFVEVFLRDYANDSLESFFRGKKFGGYFVPEHIDTVTMSRMMFGTRLTDNKLGTVLEAAGIELTDAHNAMNDVDGTERFVISGFQKLRAKVTQGTQQGPEETVGRRFRTTFQIV